MAKILFIDLETTGFSREWDSIIEVAAILYDEEQRKQIAKFHEYIKPTKRIPEAVVNITGITNERVANCRSEREVMTDFFEWVNKHNPNKLTAYNSSFDKGFLENKKSKYSLAAKEVEWFDMMQYGRQLKREGKIENYRQPTVAQFLGIEYQAHSAIEDVTALIKIYEKLGLNKTKEAIRKSLGF